MFLDANIFQPLIDVFAAVIKLFHNNVGLSWGWSIILLTICVRCVMLPAVLELLGSVTWKIPSWLDGRLPDINIEGTSPAAHHLPEPAGGQ